MTILVTGSAGHLGEALMRSLRSAGRPVRGVDIKPSAFTDHVGSIGDRAFIKQVIHGVHAVLHAATLHKPHVATHNYQAFLDTNLAGTLALLDEAAAEGVGSFIFTSTTSAFGSALTPADGEPAAWVTEDVVPVTKNIYGATKLGAEALCELFARKHGLPVIILRTSRFFPEVDDDPAIRDNYGAANAQANELLNRRVDLEDVVGAHLLAVERARSIGFGRYIVSATTPFTRDHLAALRKNAPQVVHQLFSDCEALFGKRSWSLFPHIDRVYVNERARVELGWRPKYDFRHVLDCLRAGKDFRSPLARDVGSKGYHDTIFEDGPYPVAQ
ncbi:NAD(P)-dependent oxidoreductase [Mesorhizobium sp. 1M-11]|uniref:NAD-dependent epimerase/dehydratase family protein n=1 Tax=Mesorhizobium sp. 1M-11 TaxID=1529006 RepID=UPI0006C75AFA|nr:NAD(P)-dependent oxidoreductase [Mesorhizobium sp. 1M-11]